MEKRELALEMLAIQKEGINEGETCCFLIGYL